MIVITREDAKAKGLTRYFTGRPCKNGHVCERSVCNKQCRECFNINRRAYLKRRAPELAAAAAQRKAPYMRAYYLKTIERRRTYSTDRAAKIADLLAVLRAEMPELLKEFGL